MVAEALGIAREQRDDATMADLGAQQVYQMVGRMKLPQRLREVGVKEEDLPRLAELAAASKTVQNNPGPVSAEQLERVLREMW